MTKNAAKEYRHFIEKYLLPLLGISNDNIEKYIGEFKGNAIVQENNYIFFSTNSETVYKINCVRKLSTEDLNLAQSVISFFFKVAEYRMDNKGIAHKYYSSIQKDSNYEMAIQKGICSWIIGTNNDDVEKLLRTLEKWSVQTYEGKNVTLGFVIDPNAKSNFEGAYGSFKNFIRDDFSAVFTDCIQSVIELDDHCEFCRYLSITETGAIEDCKLTKRVPVRFSNVIQKYITDSKVGIFLLNNGDIILSKNQEVRFVKRNLKWLNMSYEAFRNVLDDFITKNNIQDSLVEDIYASMLDVSFSHTGGIISVINDVSLLTKEDKDGFPILHKCDFLLDSSTYNELYQFFKDENKKYKECGSDHLVITEKDIKKRILKRIAIDSFIQNKSFGQLDRKLRSELISLDGACILTSSGQVCSCGAIIKNDSGSSGGGRGAASKKLSRFGVAIKISTDGYIELFIKGVLKYSIK